MAKIQACFKKQAVLLCAETGDGDGVDPKWFARQNGRKKTSTKDRQLSKEALRELSLILVGETQNPVLRDLVVLSVEPEASGQGLTVTVGHVGEIAAYDEADVQEALARAQGHLRSLLARSLHRKRVPLLRFHYAGRYGREVY